MYPHSALPQLGISANNRLGHSHTTSCQKGDPICPLLPLASWPAPSATEEMLLRKCCTSVATPRTCWPQVEGAMPQPRWPAMPILLLALRQGHLGPPFPSNLDVFRFEMLSAQSCLPSQIHIWILTKNLRTPEFLSLSVPVCCLHYSHFHLQVSVDGN